MEEPFVMALLCIGGGVGLLALLIIRSTRQPRDNIVSYEIQAHDFVENYCKFSNEKDFEMYKKEALRKLREDFKNEEEIRKENKRLEKIIKEYDL